MRVVLNDGRTQSLYAFLDVVWKMQEKIINVEDLTGMHYCVFSVTGEENTYLQRPYSLRQFWKVKSNFVENENFLEHGK